MSALNDRKESQEEKSTILGGGHRSPAESSGSSIQAPILQGCVLLHHIGKGCLEAMANALHSCLAASIVMAWDPCVPLRDSLLSFPQPQIPDRATGRSFSHFILSPPIPPFPPQLYPLPFFSLPILFISPLHSLLPPPSCSFLTPSVMGEGNKGWGLKKGSLACQTPLHYLSGPEWPSGS